jgi:hypothetical protein
VADAGNTNPQVRRLMSEAGIKMAQQWPWQRVAPLWQEKLLAVLQDSSCACKHA